MTIIECPTCDLEIPISLDDPCDRCVRCGSAVSLPAPVIDDTEIDVTIPSEVSNDSPV